MLPPEATGKWDVSEDAGQLQQEINLFAESYQLQYKHIKMLDFRPVHLGVLIVLRWRRHEASPSRLREAL